MSRDWKIKPGCAALLKPRRVSPAHLCAVQAFNCAFSKLTVLSSQLRSRVSTEGFRLCQLSILPHNFGLEASPACQLPQTAVCQAHGADRVPSRRSYSAQAAPELEGRRAVTRKILFTLSIAQGTAEVPGAGGTRQQEPGHRRPCPARCV